jgi:hypothetical protein
LLRDLAGAQAQADTSKDRFLMRFNLGNYFRPLLGKDLQWIILIVLLNLVLFSDALFTDRTFFVRDVSFFHYPLKKLVTEAYSNGEWPLWNPFIQLGQPLLANPNSMALYPTQLLFQLLPFQTAFELHFVLHCVLAGVAAFLLGKALGLSPSSAFLAAGIYNLSGITISAVNLFNILPVVAFLPLLAWMLLRLLAAFTLLRMVASSFIFGCFFLLLEPISSLAAVLFIVPIVIAVHCLSLGMRMSWLKSIAILAGVLISGLLLACIQIFPTVELVQNSGRKGGLGFDVVSYWSLHPIGFLQMVAPRVFGEYFRMAQPASWAKQFFDGREPYLLSCYLGFFPLLIGLWGMFFAKKRWIGPILSGIAVVAVVLALGRNTPLYSWLYHHCVIFRYGRYPVKYMFAANLSLALMAGFGWQRIEELRNGLWRHSTWQRARVYFLWVTPLILFLFVLGLRSPFVWKFLGIGELGNGFLSIKLSQHSLQVDVSIIHDSLKHVQVHLGAYLLVLLLIGWKKIRLEIVRYSVFALIFFDLLINNFWINPVIPGDFYEPAPAALYLKNRMQKEGLFRIYSLENQRWQDQPSVLGESDSIAWVSIFRKLTLFQFLAAQEHVQYSVFDPIDRLETPPSQRAGQELASSNSLDARIRVLGKLNVGAVLSVQEVASSQVQLEALFEINSNQPLRIYRITNPLPRAFLTQDVRLEKARPESLTSITPTTGQPDRGQDLLSTISLTSADPRFCQPVNVTHYSPNRVALEAASPHKCLLVLLDSYYPGWKASIDGQACPIYSHGLGFRAIDFPPGNHQVEFEFRSSSFRNGLCVSVATAIGWCIALLLNIYWRKRTKVEVRAEYP